MLGTLAYMGMCVCISLPTYMYRGWAAVTCGSNCGPFLSLGVGEKEYLKVGKVMLNNTFIFIHRTFSFECELHRKKLEMYSLFGA